VGNKKTTKKALGFCPGALSFVDVEAPLTRPRLARGHADEARRQSFEERHHLAAAKLLSDDDVLGRVDAVNLEYVLGEIQTDRSNLHVDGSLM
jgi:hypothetical protein